MKISISQQNVRIYVVLIITLNISHFSKNDEKKSIILFIVSFEWKKQFFCFEARKKSHCFLFFFFIAELIVASSTRNPNWIEHETFRALGKSLLFSVYVSLVRLDSRT